MPVNENILTKRLEIFGPLDSADRKLLDAIVRSPMRVPPRTSVIREGAAPLDVHLVLDGFACRSKTLQDGKRQILAYLVPGDFCDLHVFILRAMDHDIETLSACTIVKIPRTMVLELLNRPHLARALWWTTLVDEATLREWIVNIGQRESEERVAHLFCELHRRLQSVGLVVDGRFDLPITQVELAETAGMSAVHMNRSLQSLRSRGFIELSSGALTILDVREMEKFAGFNPNYLHLYHGKVDRPQGHRAPGHDDEGHPEARG